MKALLALIAAAFQTATADTIPAGDLRISPESREMILYYETGGQGYYQTRLQRPTVPPGQSGITIGIGYDLGYNTPAQIRADWLGVLPEPQVDRLAGVAGKTGASARAALSRVRDIIVPWGAASKVYEQRTVPRFAKLTINTYPGIKATHPHIQGVILSTTFNRGSAMTPYERRKELVWTRDDLRAGKFDRLPSYQLAMRRLWPTIPGLQKRYAAHAGLIKNALTK
jgi:hypothetical protein